METAIVGVGVRDNVSEGRERLVCAHINAAGASALMLCAEAGLMEEDFSSAVMGGVYAAAVRLHEAGQLGGGGEILAEECFRAGLTPANYIEATRLEDFSGMPSAELPPACRALKRMAANRLMKAHALALAEALKGGDEDRANALVMKMNETRTEAKPRASWHQTGGVQIERAKAIIAGLLDPDDRSVPWPWQQFDLEFKPFRRGELAVIAGQPSLGKSSLLRQIVIHAARHGQNCAFVSMEVPNGDLFNLMASSLCGQPWSRLRQIAPVDQRDFVRGLERVREAGIESIDDCKSLPGILAWLKGQHQRRFLDVVAVDYLGLVNECKPAKNETKAQSVGEVAAAFKNLASELGCVLLLAVQINRNADKEKNREPRLTDLKDSGDIEAHADRVILLHRPDTDENGNRQSAHDPIGERARYYHKILQEKGRNVGTGMGAMYFNRDCARYELMQL